MEDMNVESYFLIVLGGFGIVWGYRLAKYANSPKPLLNDFEYAAWSAFWGSLCLQMLLLLTWKSGTPSAATLEGYIQVPFLISPIIVMVGLAIGAVAGKIHRFFIAKK